MQAEIYSITPFDAESGTTIKYNWRSTQRAVKLRITDATGTTVYETTITTNVRQVNIPASGTSNLTNGLDHSYIAYIQVQDSNRDWSEESAGVSFLCLKTPFFEFSNYDEGVGYYAINAYSYTFSVIYEQDDGERLASWKISLYGADNTLLSTSGIQTSVNHTETGTKVTGTFSYPFSGFSDKRAYKIQAEGKTTNGLTVVTDYVGVNSDYSTSSVFALLNAKNEPSEGRIRVSSNVVSIICKVYDPDGNEIPEDELDDNNLLLSGDYTNPSNNEVINGNHALILPTGYRMVLDEGFKIGGDNSIAMIFVDPTPNKDMFSMYESGQELEHSETGIHLYYRVGRFTEDWDDSPTDQQACFELVVDGTINTIYVSNAVDRPETGGRVGVVIVREGGRYSLFASSDFRLKSGAQDPIESYARSENGSVG